MNSNKEIEAKWQAFWENDRTFEASNNSDLKKYYYLIEFPFPSGDGLHVGHVRSYTALDVMARRKRMLGYNVLYPIGWDAFGLPTEQYAIKNKVHPKEAAAANIKNFTKQIKSLGISFDWSREITTSDPSYYKWTQWQFLKFYEQDMAYKEKKEINWCPNCKIGLSNEESSGNVCERCGNSVEKKLKEQWMLKMSSYSEKLLTGLEETNFIDRVKNSQINWIGKSVGAIVNFEVANTTDTLEVFTTRADTLYGVTYLCLSPEHNLIDKLSDSILNLDEVLEYRKLSSVKSDIERCDNTKEKTGIKLEGLTVINPINNKELDIFVSDYVLNNYATGAIMGVPAHDERDYAFAKKYNIDIIEVISGGNIEEAAYTKDGVMINSEILNGLDNKKDSIKTMINYLEKEKIGYEKVNYKLQDWVFSRQRFWGEPIPMIKCDDCGYVPVDECDLPVLLPDIASYEPTENGESPLAKIESFVNTTCPKCKKSAKRETDTMPNWAGSSWYYLRYMDSDNNEVFASKEAMEYWNMVDFYNGGMEHATRHLLYARFWHRFMYDTGLIPYKEPFNKRVAHGMILGPNGEKMSKSKGNVLNPNDLIENYGADALRVYEMFTGDYEQDCAWSENGLKGCRRFLDRVINLRNKLSNDANYKEVESLIHKTIKKVSNDIENMKFNTAISALMILVNKLEIQDSITKDSYIILLTLLNPFAPHITEELNEIIGNDKLLCKSSWPTYDDSKTIDDEYELVVQVNGKVRGKIIAKTTDEDDVLLDLASNIPNVVEHIKSKEIIKKIVVKGKLVSFVVK